MAYTTITNTIDDSTSIKCNSQNLFIPRDEANTDCQEMLDAVIAQGADCWDGDIPEDIQAAADAKQALGLTVSNSPDPHA